jgi:tetrahydrodipicolinate N-succinyltransferase
MKDNYDDLNDTFNTEIEVQQVNEAGCVRRKDVLPNITENDAEKDYKYARAQLYSLIEKGQETLNGVMELAGESASPRAYEVAGQVLKSTADITDKLADLQKKMKDLDEDNVKTTNNVTNNAVFVGSTTELQKMLKQEILNNKDE